MRWLSRFENDERGAAMAEFAIVATVFFAMLMGIVETGLAAWQKNAASSDAREGARYAAVHGTRSGHVATVDSVSKYVKSITVLDTAHMRVYAVWPTDKQVGSIVEISVAHDVPRRGPFIPAHRDSVTSKVAIMF